MYTTVMISSLLAGGLTAQEIKSTQNSLVDQPPEVTEPLQNYEASEESPNTVLDLSNHFYDPDTPEAALTYAVSHTSKPAVAIVIVDNQTLTIDYLAPGQSNVIITAEYNGQATADTFIIGVRPVIKGDYDVATFDDLPLDPESFWNGSDSSGGFTSGTVNFFNSYNPDWQAWYSWSYSNTTDNTTPGWTNPYSAFSPVRLDSTVGKNFGVTYTSPLSQITTPFGTDHLFQGFFVTNSTYAALSMKEGDDYTKKFGGDEGSDPDWFKLTVTGTRSDSTKATVDFYLADYRFENPANDYIIETWQWIDLTPLGKVNKLSFELSSTDNGDWGMNTPAYFCMDNLYSVPEPPTGPFITEVLEYLPAPSQYMNAAPWGTPSSPQSLINGVNGSVSLGAFGGYIVFRFEQPVRNHPDNPYGADFTIFGNPMPNWSEPGIVSVMNDENGNDLPDDTWYELAGSDYHFSTADHNYSVTYSNPYSDVAADVPWSDSQGNEGLIQANSYFTQPYYPLPDSFPSIDQEQYTLSGSMIRSTIDTAFETTVYSLRRAFGYTDNQSRGKAPYNRPDNPYTPEVENAGGDAFDISWAVDADGNHVELDMIHFVKVHTGVMDGAGWLGQISTEITGAAVVEPDPTLKGNHELVVIREIPPVLTTTAYQMEAFAFRKGRLLQNEPVNWSATQPGAYVDETGLLHLEGSSGELTLTAAMVSNSAVYASVTTTVDLAVSTENRMAGNFDSGAGAASAITLYPNPASSFITLKDVEVFTMAVYDISGRRILKAGNNSGFQRLDISTLPNGIYILEADTKVGLIKKKFIKQ